MKEIELPSRHLALIHEQPDFPYEDLSDDNTAMLSHVLSHEVSMEAYAHELAPNQNYIHLIADRALKSLDIQTEYNPDELSSFSQGFAGLEAISDIVHGGTKPYDFERAGRFISKYFVDNRSLDIIERERKVQPPSLTLLRRQAILEDPFADPLDDLAATLEEVQDDKVAPATHDKNNPEQGFTTYYEVLKQAYPNTYSVISAMGEKRDQTMAQLHLRAAGAQLAHNLQVEN